MSIATPLARLRSKTPADARRLRLARPLAVAGLALALAGGAILAWPDSAVVVESSPSGADVILDGRIVGQTPLRLASRPWPLRDEVAVSLAGHRGWSGTVEAGLAETRHLALPLDPLPASVALKSTPAGAQVNVDGREAGLTPLELANLAPGRHSVALTLAGHQRWEAAIDLEPGGRLRREIQLAPVAPAVQAAAPVASQAASDARGAPTEVPASAPSVESEPVAARPQPAAEARPEPFPSIIPPHAGSPFAALAVMVENAPAARPQSGLAAADLVYEALAEGGISRFMAVYFGADDAVVGPVRSARHYFVNLADELGASVVHVGASPLGYDVLRAAGLRTLDETHAHPGFWRSRTRPAPHNTYTRLRDARQALDGRGSAGPGQWAGFTFKDPAKSYQGPAAPLLALDYEPWGYQVEYRFEPETKRYARFMAGAPHADAETGQQIRAANVVVMRVSAWVIDAEGRLDMDQVSHGPAAYFLDGVVVNGNWRKTATDQPTRFLDEAGNPVRFNPGPIWVQMIPYEGKVEY